MKVFLIGHLIIVIFFVGIATGSIKSFEIGDLWSDNHSVRLEALNQLGDQAQSDVFSQKLLVHFLFSPFKELQTNAQSYLIKLEHLDPKVIEWLLDITSSQVKEEIRVMAVEILGSHGPKKPYIGWKLLNLLPSFNSKVYSATINALANQVRRENILHNHVLADLNFKTSINYYPHNRKSFWALQDFWKLSFNELNLVNQKRHNAILILANSGLSDTQTQESLSRVFLSSDLPIEDRLQALWSLRKLRSLSDKVVQQISAGLETSDTRIRLEILNFLSTRDLSKGVSDYKKNCRKVWLK